MENIDIIVQHCDEVHLDENREDKKREAWWEELDKAREGTSDTSSKKSNGKSKFHPQQSKIISNEELVEKQRDS